MLCSNFMFILPLEQRTVEDDQEDGNAESAEGSK